MPVICTITTNDGSDDHPQPTDVEGTLNLVMFWPDYYMTADLLPVDEVSVVFSDAVGEPTKFTIYATVIHKHDKPKDPTPQAGNMGGSNCKIQNNTIYTDKRFEIHITAPVTNDQEDTWVFDNAHKVKLEMAQPKQLKIRVKRQTGSPLDPQ